MIWHRFICAFCGVVLPRETDAMPTGLCPGCYGCDWRRK